MAATEYFTIRKEHNGQPETISTPNEIDLNAFFSKSHLCVDRVTESNLVSACGRASFNIFNADGSIGKEHWTITLFARPRWTNEGMRSKTYRFDHLGWLHHVFPQLGRLRQEQLN